MNILFLTPVPPGDKSGGEIAVKQSLLSLMDSHQIHYLGPNFDGCSFNLSTTQFIKQNQSLPLRCFNLLKGITSSYYSDFSNKLRFIDWNTIDIVFIEFARFDFLIDHIPKNKKILLRCHNVESNYFQAKFKTDKNVSNLIRYFFSFRQERKMVNRADHIVSLTEVDTTSIKNMYKAKCGFSVIPICVEGNTKEHVSYFPKKEGVINVITTGSLWYGANSAGILKVLSRLPESPCSKNVRYTIAGSDPCYDLKAAVKNIMPYENVVLVENPESMDDVFDAADIVLAPVFEGSGMKVKLAEALSRGLPIIASEHAAIGYDTCEAIKVCRDESDMLESLDDMIKNSKASTLSQSAFLEFNTRYNIASSIKSYQRVLNNTYLKNGSDDKK